MTLRTQVLVWIAISVAAIVLLWLFRSILLPFVIGLALAYLLNPVVALLERLRIDRTWGSMLALAAAISMVLGLLLALVPLVAQQGAGLIARLPTYIRELQALLQEWAPQLSAWLGPERVAQLEANLADLLGRGVELTAALTAQLAQGGINILTTIAVLFVAPVVAYYLLVDWAGMVRKADELLPRPQQAEIRGILSDVDGAMAGVIRGQGGVILVLCAYYGTALTLVGLNFGLAIGLVGGLLSFIPYVGFLIGFTLSMAIALVQFWPDQWVFILIVLGIYAVGQFLESNILYPKLVGQSININPVWLMFALFAFGLLFGFVGLLLAVPLAAISGVLTRYAIAKYQASSLYLGVDEAVAPIVAPIVAPSVPLPASAAAPAPKPRGRQRSPSR